MTAYSYLERILNTQFLGDTQISDFLYERLMRKSREYQCPSLSQHIFITGLARAGTTCLLNQLYSTQKLASICYKHMPFILSPRIASFAAQYTKDVGFKERSQKDGIFISPSSPECLDEPFWIKSDPGYYRHPLQSNTKYHTNVFKAYDCLLSEYSKRQDMKPILIKNNNNHIRLHQLTNHFPHSLFLCVFRHPIPHSVSLRNSHEIFLKLHKLDTYTSEYLNLLGHREFGVFHRRFVYQEITQEDSFETRTDNLNYWLEQWIQTHSWYLESGLVGRNNILWICYEHLCSRNENLEMLFTRLGLMPIRRTLHSNRIAISINDSIFESQNLAYALDIYKRLVGISLN